jgi:DNA-binding transcriptional regulator YiaG
MKKPITWGALAVRELRESLGESQTAFAKRLGVRQATVSDWECGKRSPYRLGLRALEATRKSTAQVTTET